MINIPILKDIPTVLEILDREMELLKSQSSKWIYVSERGRKELKKGSITFYFVEVYVEKSSYDFVYSEYDPFVIKDGDSLQLNKNYNCYCIFVKSPLEFTLVFEDYVPPIRMKSLNKINPSGNIERQIDLIGRLEEEKKIVIEDLRYVKSKPDNKKDFDKKRGSFDSYLLTLPTSSSHFEYSEFSRYCYIQPKTDINVEFTTQSLTKSQKKAISEAISSSSFYLIHGPPGTGKTTVITDIVLNLIAEGKKVLICSWMNVAVDNFLEKLIKSKKIRLDEIARIGAGTFKVSKDVQTILLQKGIQQQSDKFKVVGSTLASAYLSTPLIGNKLFDVVIVDEAGASTVPQTLLALTLGKKFILVGDHYQLPPILQVTPDNSEIPLESINDMKISLFEGLFNRWPNFTTILDTQYRMDEKIAELSNILVYNNVGKLKTGTDTSFNYLPKKNQFPINPSELSLESQDELKKVLCKEYPLIWLNVDGRHEWDTVQKSSCGPRSAYNIEEVNVVEGIYRFMKEALPDLKNENVGIITPYRKQVEKLNKLLGDEILNGLEISTVDSFQGKEKDIIIFSTVYAPKGLQKRKKDAPNVFKDKRRFNVAFTRAKYKLIIVGDVELVRRDVQYFLEAFKYIRDAYGDPNNSKQKRGIIKDIELCEYFKELGTGSIEKTN